MLAIKTAHEIQFKIKKPDFRYQHIRQFRCLNLYLVEIWPTWLQRGEWTVVNGQVPTLECVKRHFRHC